jgi:hypothetical protein
MFGLLEGSLPRDTNWKFLVFIINFSFSCSIREGHTEEWWGDEPGRVVFKETDQLLQAECQKSLKGISQDRLHRAAMLT